MLKDIISPLGRDNLACVVYVISINYMKCRRFVRLVRFIVGGGDCGRVNQLVSFLWVFCM